MSVPSRQENVGRSRTRRFTDMFSSHSPTTTSFRPVIGSGRLNSEGALPVDRNGPRDESVVSNTSSSRTQLVSLPEVVEEVLENRQNPKESEHSVHDLHQHPALDSVQGDGGKIWNKLDTHSRALQEDLRVFQDTVQGLGSSLDLAQSARRVRECLSSMTWLFRENARMLFPQAVEYIEPPQVDAENTQRRPRPSWPPPTASAQTIIHHGNPSPVYKELKSLADSLKFLRNALEQFPEFENYGKRTLRCFEGDLEYWSSCLGQYGDGDLSREVQVYIHDLSQELAYRLEETRDCVKRYIACVPTARLAQEHALSNLQTLATIATFFSAVTASTLQFSIANTNPKIMAQVVNTLWASSLVFSIASALNSSLAFMWKSAIYSSPHTRLRGWLWLWIRQSPAVFLLLSVGSFLVGLGFFVASSQQHHIWIVVIVCEGVSSFSVVALLVWLVVDKWTFYRLQLQQRRSGKSPLNQLFGGKSGSVLPTHVEHTASWSMGYISRSVKAFTSVSDRIKPSIPQSAPWRLAFKSLHAVSTAPIGSQHHPVVHAGEPYKSPAKARWEKAIEKAKDVVRTTQEERASRATQELDRMDQLQSSLPSLYMDEDGIRHEAGPATSSIQFDPDGNCLAICGKRLTMRWDVGPTKREPLKLPHYVGLARQVIWTLCGKHVITRTHRAVHIWSLSGNPDRKMHIRYERSNFILGIPATEENSTSRFISIEGANMNKLAIIDIHGEEEQKAYDFDNLSIQHVDILPSGMHVILAVEASESPDGLKPMSAAPARKMIVFNLQKFQVEHEVPLWHAVQHVSISKNGQMAVVTYNAGPPPQLWRLRMTLAGIRLSLELQFTPKKYEETATKQTQFLGKGHFLNNDRFVLCTTTAGEIHIWRRDQAEPVHIIDHLSNENDRPLEITCNPKSDDFMFATRSQNGLVRIWKTRREVPTITPRAETPEISNIDNVLGLHSENGKVLSSAVLRDSPTEVGETVQLPSVS